jgi:hypothetical protein
MVMADKNDVCIQFRSPFLYTRSVDMFCSSLSVQKLFNISFWLENALKKKFTGFAYSRHLNASAYERDPGCAILALNRVV